jgi:hypothetical protein
MVQSKCGQSRSCMRDDDSRVLVAGMAFETHPALDTWVHRPALCRDEFDVRIGCGFGFGGEGAKYE